MKIKYKGKVYDAVVWGDDSIRSKDGLFLGFSIEGLVEGAEVQEDAPKAEDAKETA